MTHFAAPIVHIEGNRVFATSKDVAEFFEKPHNDVMKAVRAVLEADPALSGNFSLIEIDTLVGYGWRKFPAYEMDRKGFTMLAFGFTGEKAVKFKSRYIDAFDEAIKRLRELETAKPTNTEPTPNPLPLGPNFPYKSILIRARGRPPPSAPDPHT